MKRQHIVILLVLALVIGFAGGFAGFKVTTSSDDAGTAQKEPDTSESEKDNSNQEDSNSDSDENAPEDMDKVVKAFHLIQDYYLEGADDKQLIEGAIKGMVNSLDDP